MICLRALQPTATSFTSSVATPSRVEPATWASAKENDMARTPDARKTPMILLLTMIPPVGSHVVVTTRLKRQEQCHLVDSHDSMRHSLSSPQSSARANGKNYRHRCSRGHA